MRQQPTGQDLLAVHSESQACHRDTDLGSRDVQVLPSRLREDVGHTLGQRAPLRGLMLDRRAGCPDDGELGRDEQAVGNDQHENHADWDEDLCHALSSGRVRRDAAHQNRHDGAVGDPLDFELVGPDGRAVTWGRQWPSVEVTSPPTVAASVSQWYGATSPRRLRPSIPGHESVHRPSIRPPDPRI